MPTRFFGVPLRDHVTIALSFVFVARRFVGRRRCAGVGDKSPADLDMTAILRRGLLLEIDHKFLPSLWVVIMI